MKQDQALQDAKPEAAEPKTVETAATELQIRCEEYLAGWKRAQADYANLKKENEKERSTLVKFANERLLSEILPAVDLFENALTFSPDFSGIAEQERTKVDAWLAGLKAVSNYWETVFKDIGLKRITTEGLFDPSIHEAMAQEEADEDGKILRTVQSGWQFDDRVLRPAKVVVGKAKQAQNDI